MTTERGITTVRGVATLALVLIVGVISTACGGSPAAAPASAGSPPVAGAPTAATQAQAPPVSTPAGNPANSNRDCQALANAAFDLNSSEPSLVVLAGRGGSAVNRVDSSFYVDTAKLRADLDVLAVLPDPTDATEISLMGKPSEAIPQFRQLLDLIDQDAGAAPAPGSTPAAGGTASDPQLAAFFGAKLIKMSTAINAAMGTACPDAAPNVPAAGQPAAPATPLPAGYTIGQTAPVGDLRVSLDKVVTVPGAGALLPAPGTRFVFVSITVENTGKVPFQVNTLTGTHWEDAAGKQYYSDPDTIMLDPNTTNFDGGIQPGAKQSGAIGYQLPRDAGDLVWVFEDFKPNRAVFGVPASAVADAGTPVTEPTAAAMRAEAAATQTAFVGMMTSAAATQDAAGADTPAADTPPPAVPTDTAPVGP